MRQGSFPSLAPIAHSPSRKSPGWGSHGASYPDDADFALGLDVRIHFDPVDLSYPTALHLAVVIVDEETGVVTVKRLLCHRRLRASHQPRWWCTGQVHGGLAQGMGQALCERVVYDEESGQLISGSFMDYCLPRADDLPSFSIELPVHPQSQQRAGCQRLQRERLLRTAVGNRQRDRGCVAGYRSAAYRSPVHPLAGLGSTSQHHIKQSDRLKKADGGTKFSPVGNFFWSLQSLVIFAKACDFPQPPGTRVCATPTSNLWSPIHRQTADVGHF